MIAWTRSSSIIFVFSLVLLLPACGKKGPPKPPKQEKLPRVGDLEAVAVVDGVRLRWTIGSANNEVAGFNIYRSKPQPYTSDCPGCTRDYELITAIAVKEGQTRFQAIDSYVEAKGRIYYKVIAFDKRDRTGSDSNEAGVVLE